MEGNVSYSDVAAMVRGSESGMGGNGYWNNPFMYLIWYALFRNGGFGGGDGQAAANVELSNRINSLGQQIADNQSANTLNAGIMGNGDKIMGTAGRMDLGFAGLNAAINNASMQNVIGQKDMQAGMASCCCDIKSNILNQTNQLQTAINGVQNSLINGFAQVGFLTQQQTNELNVNANANTQRILDKMCADTTQGLRDKLAEASQNAQTNYLISQLKTTAA